MCGIIGYIGSSDATPILLDGLRRLEYRGYDSAGIATLENGEMELRKCSGRIASLTQLVQKYPTHGTTGIGHTRWATHGRVTDENAHPPGPRTKKALLHAFRLALKQVIGTYGLALFHVDVPDVLLGARRGSPLILGVGKGQNFIVSDVSAIVAHTRDVVYLDDYDVVASERDRFDILSLAGADASFQVSKVEFSTEDVDLGAFPHFMLKEIFEQPNSIRDSMRGRLSIE